MGDSMKSGSFKARVLSASLQSAGLTIVIWLAGVSSVLGQPFSAELVERIPGDTLVCIEIPDVPALVRSIEKSGIGSTVDRTPLGQVLQHLLHRQSASAGEALETGLFAELGHSLSGSMSASMFPAEDGRLGFFFNAGIRSDCPLGRVLDHLLREDPGAVGLLPMEYAGLEQVWRHRNGAFVHRANDDILISDDCERFVRWGKGQPVSGDSGSRFAESRKWVRVRENLGVDSAGISCFVDTDGLLQMTLSGQPNGRRLAESLAPAAVSDALAAGWTIRFDSGRADVRLDAFLLCAVPRQGLWGALTLKPLENLVVPHCPKNTGYAMVSRSDLGVLVRTLVDLERHAVSEHGLHPDEFLDLIGNLGPILVVPLMMRERVEETFTGEVFLFGSGQVSQRAWLNDMSVGAGVLPGAEEEAFRFLQSIVPSNDRLIQKRTGAHQWWLQGDQSYNATVARVAELEAEGVPDAELVRVPRMAFLCERERLILFGSEETVEPSLRATDDPDTGLASDGQFRSIVRYLAESDDLGMPSALFFCRGEELLKWPLFRFVGPGAGFRDSAWRQNSGELRRQGNQLLADARESYLEFSGSWPGSGEMAAGLGPVGGAVWDQPAGLRGSLFLLKRSSD